MKTYIITYDLKDSWKNRDYSDFYSAIKEISFEDPFQHVCESSWLVKTEMTAEEIFNKLFPILGKENILFVSEINLENKAGWIFKPLWDWFKKEDKDYVDNQRS